MFNEKLKTCPVCGKNMVYGFSSRNYGLSWITADNMKKFAFMDKDLNEAGLDKFLPAIAKYDLSYNCPKCKIYIVDYSKPVSSKEAKELAKTL
jgi:ssDNA-binding Zn-finger/Zn-ribbon topoisomerase 1